jgi:hypothetical protein
MVPSSQSGCRVRILLTVRSLAASNPTSVASLAEPCEESGTAQRRNYEVAQVTNCPGSRAGGGPLGPSAWELKTLKVCLSVNYNFIKIFISYVVFIK